MYLEYLPARVIAVGALIFIGFSLAGCSGQPAPAATPLLAPTAAPSPPAPAVVPSPTARQPSTAAATTSPGAQTLPISDGHIHYSQDSAAAFSVDSIQSILDQAGVERALVSSTPNEGSLRLHEADPERFIPELRPYRTRGDMGTWFDDPEIIGFLEQELERGVYRGIGEFHLNGDDAKTQVVKDVVDLAVARGLPLHAHSDPAAIEALLAANQDARVLWAHAGMSTPTETIAQMLERYPNLWVELSYRYDIVQGGRLDPAWRELFTRHPERFVYGSDTWVASRWEQLPELVQTARGWLAELPGPVAEQIAYRNWTILYGP